MATSLDFHRVYDCRLDLLFVIMNKKQRIAAARASNDAYYKSLGWTPGKKSSPHKIPDYRTDCREFTSDKIPAHGPARNTNRYTGDELLGIATMHKSNAVPIRKDSKESAKDVSQMRRS